MADKLLEVKNLKKYFKNPGGTVHAVDDISFSIARGETVGIVGESGCGKTTTARMLVRMYEPDGGGITFHGENGPVSIGELRGSALRRYRQRVKYVFQDPARSLNPRMSVLEVLTSGYLWSGDERQGGSARVKIGKDELRAMAVSALEEVGLSSADLDKRPSEFSGGQRQRISIARGLLPQPEILICDEVVSALDVSVQSKVLNLLHDIRENRKRESRSMSFLFIAHDLKVACYFCDRIGVMYAGQLVEEAPASSLWSDCRHPYTRLLFSSATGARPDGYKAPDLRKLQHAGPPVSSEGAEGCAFAPRCPQAMDKCRRQAPPMAEAAEGHKLRCHLQAAG
jgi:oligopeptide/dipeptide ABC transporter ATP-binding protein